MFFFPDGSWEFRNCRSSRTFHSQQLSIPFAHTNSYFYSFFLTLPPSGTSYLHNLRQYFFIVVVVHSIRVYILLVLCTTVHPVLIAQKTTHALV